MHKFKIILFFLFFTSVGFSQTNDSLKTKKSDTDVFYRTQFSVFDTLVKKNDTLYLRPIMVEPKMVLQDSVLKNLKAGDVQQVVVSTFEVAKRNKNADLSYFLIPKPSGFVYDQMPRANSQIMFDALSPIRSEISFWKKNKQFGFRYQSRYVF